jgi:hypothetical protein
VVAQIVVGLTIWIVASIVLAPVVGALIRGAERLAEPTVPPEAADPHAPGRGRTAA